MWREGTPDGKLQEESRIFKRDQIMVTKESTDRGSTTAILLIQLSGEPINALLDS